MAWSSNKICTNQLPIILYILCASVIGGLSIEPKPVNTTYNYTVLQQKANNRLKANAGLEVSKR